MNSPQTAQALIDYIKLHGPGSFTVDAVLQKVYTDDPPLNAEDRLWVVNHVLGTVRRNAIGESVEIVESTCQNLYTLAKMNRVPGAEMLTSGIAQMADHLMSVVEATRKQYGLDSNQSG